jgi:hypothetical protein
VVGLRQRAALPRPHSFRVVVRMRYALLIKQVAKKRIVAARQPRTSHARPATSRKTRRFRRMERMDSIA